MCCEIMIATYTVARLFAIKTFISIRKVGHKETTQKAPYQESWNSYIDLMHTLAMDRHG